MVDTLVQRITKTPTFMFGLMLLLFAWVSSHPQSNTAIKDYTVIKNENTTESGNNVFIFDYYFKGSTIKTREKYFKNREEQDEGLAAAIKDYKGCVPQLGIFTNTGTVIGRKIVCENRSLKTYVIAYSHFDVLNKVYVISGESRRIVEEFVQACPFAYHLNPDIECPGS